MSRLSARDRRDAESRRLRDENERLRAEVADLKARLCAERLRHLKRVGGPPDARICATCRATDLRVKNWRKP